MGRGSPLCQTRDCIKVITTSAQEHLHSVFIYDSHGVRTLLESWLCVFTYLANRADSDPEKIYCDFCSRLLQLLWNYKLNLTTDPKFESVATEVCKSTIAEVSLRRGKFRVQFKQS